jgi:hypothetical protein
MLAGDVLVSVVNGHLLIEGDAEANQIAVTAGATAGSFIVQGIGDTEVRQASAPSTEPPAPPSGLVVEGVRGNVRITLGDGADELSLHAASFRRDVVINTGAGTDFVNIGVDDDVDPTAPDESANVNIRGSLLIRTGADGDAVNLGSARIGGVSAVVTDGGDDEVNVGAAAFGTVATPGVIGAGETAMLHSRRGIDILLGEGSDSATFTDVAASRGQIVVGGGEGDDDIALNEVSAAVIGIRGGFGDGVDEVTLTGVRAWHTGIEVGGGADEASLIDCAFNSLVVALGSGDDTLSLQNVKATLAFLIGGEGDADEIIRSGDNSLARQVVTGFEIPIDANTPPVFPRHGFGSGGLGGSMARLLSRLRR